MFLIRLLMVAIPLQLFALTIAVGVTYWPAIKYLPSDMVTAKRVASLIYDGLFEKMDYFQTIGQDGKLVVVKG